MPTQPNPPVILRRIAQLESMVVRLAKDLGSLREAVAEHGRIDRREDRPAEAGGPGAASGQAGALARGEAARVQWVKDGLVVTGETLARAWGLTRQALGPAVSRGELFSIKVGNRLYYPHAFLGLDRETVAGICRGLGSLSSGEKLMFWLRDHGALGGKNVAAALDAGMAVDQVERLAAAWSRERGANTGNTPAARRTKTTRAPA